MISGADLARIRAKQQSKLEEYADDPWDVAELIRHINDLALRGAVTGALSQRANIGKLIHALSSLLLAEKETEALHLLQDLLDRERSAMMAAFLTGSDGEAH